MKFKVGDKVKCIRRRGYQLTKIGSVYTVDGYRENGNVMLINSPTENLFLLIYSTLSLNGFIIFNKYSFSTSSSISFSTI